MAPVAYIMLPGKPQGTSINCERTCFGQSTVFPLAGVSLDRVANSWRTERWCLIHCLVHCYKQLTLKNATQIHILRCLVPLQRSYVCGNVYNKWRRSYICNVLQKQHCPYNFVSCCAMPRNILYNSNVTTRRTYMSNTGVMNQQPF